MRCKIRNIITKLISPKKNFHRRLNEISERESIKHLGFESEDLTYFEYLNLKTKFPNAKLKPIDKLLITTRKIKEEKEISYIRKACRITDDCFKIIKQTIKEGDSEKEIAERIQQAIKDKGFESAFDPIVASDKSSSIPHYNTKQGLNRKVKKNSIILIDFGVKYKHYVSDMTRMVFIGKPSDEMKNVYETLLNAQQKTIQYLKKSNRASEVDSFCRKLIANYPTYPHSTGHGLGLEIHEYPKISSVSKEKIAKNQVFTIEPAVYFNGKFGIRIEDTIWMKENKEPCLITKSSKRI